MKIRGHAIKKQESEPTLRSHLGDIHLYNTNRGSIQTEIQDIERQIHNKKYIRDDDVLQSRCHLARLFESLFQLKARLLNFSDPDSEFVPENTNLYLQKFEDKKPEKRDTRRVKWSRDGKNILNLRFLQFNVLAHGLSGTGSGFATLFKPGAPHDQNEVMKHIHSQGYLDILYSKQENEMDKAYNAKDKKAQKEAMDDHISNKHQSERIQEFPLRLMRALGIILREHPDVVTLEEVDRFPDFRKYMNDVGYEGIFQRKPYGGAAQKGSGRADGVAIFWNTEKLRLNGYHGQTLPVYDRDGDKQKQLIDGSSGKYKTKPNKQVVLLAAFHPIGFSSNSDFVVAGAHLKSGAKADELEDKEFQAQVIAKMLAGNEDYFWESNLRKQEEYNLITRNREGYNRNSKNYHDVKEILKILQKHEPNVIFGADFNTSHKSPAYQKFKEAISHIESAYNFKELDGEMRFSCAKVRPDGTQIEKRGKRDLHNIDVILASKRHWKVKQTLSIPRSTGILSSEKCVAAGYDNGKLIGNTKYIPQKERKNYPDFVFDPTKCADKEEVYRLGMPNWHYPSDHFMIGAVLQLQSS